MKKRKLTPDQQIVAAFDAIDKSVATLRRFAPRYNSFIDKALLHNDKKTAMKYLRQKMRVLDLADMFETLKGNLQLGACTSKVVSSLGTLPAAIAGCKGLLAESPNFKKVGDDIRSIFADVQQTSDEISNLNKILDDVLMPAGSDLETAIGLTTDEDLAQDERLQAELEAAYMRIRADDKSIPAAEPAAETGEFDIDNLIKEENNK